MTFGLSKRALSLADGRLVLGLREIIAVHL